jgi:hypothetical protein
MMRFWRQTWRKAFYLALFFALGAVWTAAVVYAQSDSYPPPPAEPTPESTEGEPYPPPTPFTLQPQTDLPPTPSVSVPELDEAPDAAPSGGNDDNPTLPPWNQDPVSDAPPMGSGQAGQAGVGGNASPTQLPTSSLISKLFLWVAFSAALLIFAAALFWSIILFNRQAVRGR